MRNSNATRWVWAASLVLAIVAAYSGLWSNGFVAYDDPDYVLSNRHVATGTSLENVAWAFTHAHAANWHPLTWIAHMLAVDAFGLDPRGHHAVNLALHVVNAWLLFALLVRVGASQRTAWLATAVFALHPLRVESVAWVSELKDVLGAAFALLALHAWLNWVDRRGVARYVLALAAFACGLLAKPTVITLPCALLVLDVWPLARVHATERVKCWSALVAEKLPLFALAVAASLATVYAQGEGRALGAGEDYPLAARIANALHAYRTYLTQTVWPQDLIVFYPWQARGFADPSVVKGALALGLFSFLAWRGRASRPWFLTAWLWFLGTLVPMIGLVQVGAQSHADRYTYLPHVGLALALAFALEELGATRRKLADGLALAVVLALGVATFAQVRVWRDGETLFRHALAHSEKNYPMQNALADELLAGDRAEEALAVLEGGAGTYPGFRKGQFNYLRALAAVGRLDEARAVCERWQASVGPDPAFEAGLAIAYAHAGALEQAELVAARVFAVAPNAIELRRELGLALLVEGRAEDGYQALQFAATLAPDDAALARETAGARELARTPERLGDAGVELRRALALRAAALATRLEARGEAEAARRARERAAALERAR
ncbi:MAG: glycosyltransferase family 39 protein [Planctomycetes bacterium]|nr:glycosyltransferase family 39 protein [Planctomycetota bacterium]